MATRHIAYATLILRPHVCNKLSSNPCCWSWPWKITVFLEIWGSLLARLFDWWIWQYAKSLTKSSSNRPKNAQEATVWTWQARHCAELALSYRSVRGTSSRAVPNNIGNCQSRNFSAKTVQGMKRCPLSMLFLQLTNAVTSVVKVKRQGKLVVSLLPAKCTKRKRRHIKSSHYKSGNSDIFLLTHFSPYKCLIIEISHLPTKSRNNDHFSSFCA